MLSFGAFGCTSIQNAASSASDAIQTPLARTGLYLHDDSYQQKADSAVADFNKINLSSQFDDQFKKITSYDTEEDQAVATLQVAARDQKLQDFMELPAWEQTCRNQRHQSVPCCVDANGNPARCSGEPGLANEVHKELHQITGQETLNSGQQIHLREALYLTPQLAQGLDDEHRVLAIYVNALNDAGGHSPANPCSPAAPKIKPPPPLICGASDLACDRERIGYVCGEIAADTAQQRQLQTSLWVQGQLRDLIDARDKAVRARQDDQAQADALTAQISKLSSPDTSSDDFGTTLNDVRQKLDNASSSVPALAKYFGYTALANKLQSVLTGQLNENVPPPTNGNKKETNALPNGDQTPAAAPTQNVTMQPQATPTPKSNQVQALIDLATNVKTLTDEYAGKDPNARVNALLLATAAARHQADMAKLDADYQADLITIYNAEIDARLREAIHLDEANVALASRHFLERGFVQPAPSHPPQAQLDALAAWIASQDEGEIPYQILAAKEIQLLRVQSVKQGQLSAQGYENIIKPVLAQLDAYAKGGVTKEAIVQALGFVGVITSISVK